MQPRHSNVIDFGTMKRRPIVEKRIVDELFAYYDLTNLRNAYAGQRICIADRHGICHGIIWDFFNVMDVHKSNVNRLELGVIYTDENYILPQGDRYHYVTITPRKDEIVKNGVVMVNDKPVTLYTYTKP